MGSSGQIAAFVIALSLSIAAGSYDALGQQVDDDTALLIDDNLDGIEDGREGDLASGSGSDTQFSTSLDIDGAEFDNPASRVSQTSASTDTAQGNQRARRAQQVGIIQPDGSVSPLANRAAAPVQGGSSTSDESPFAAVGIRVGTFNLFPTLTQSFGSTSNAQSTSDGSAANFSQTDMRVTATSDWGIHELRGEIGGSYQHFFNGEAENLPAMDSSLELRLDHASRMTSRFGASYNLTTESAESDNLTVPPPLTITDRPNVHQMAGFAELEKQAGRFSASLRGTITQTVYEDAELSDGSSLSQSDRTNTLYQLVGRLGYETSSTLQPFVEASVGAQQHRHEIDRNGNTRDSMIYALRGGVVFDRGDKLNGEVSVGYSSEQFDDAAISDLNGLTIDASVNWSPHRITTFTTNVQTEFTGSTNANEGGSVTYAISLDAMHELRPNLSLNARVLASLRDYDGSGRQDEMLQGQVGAEWRLNRSAAIITTLGHEIVESTDSTSSYEATTARVGLRLQR